MNKSMQFSNESLSDFDVKNICNALQGDQLRSLSIRECELSDKNYKKIIKGISKNKSILQLGLNVGVITNSSRASFLADALKKNRSLTALFISGNTFGDDGMKLIGEALTQHPNIVTLDIGDCNLGDECVETICDLLPSNGAKPGLLDLTLSLNPNISIKGWSKFGISLAASSSLRELYIDYNTLGDSAASCILIGLSSNRKIEVLDLESTGITNQTAQLILYLIENYPVRLRKLVLDENNIDENFLQSIKDSIETIEDSELICESSDNVSTTSSISNQTSPIKVKVKGIETQHLKKDHKEELATLTNHMVNNNNSNNSGLRGTTSTDEDYRVLAEALEAGLQTKENGTEPTTLQEDEAELEEGTPVETLTTFKTENTDNVEEKGELEDLEKDNSDEEEELKEVPVIPGETIINMSSTEEYRKLMEKQLEDESTMGMTVSNGVLEDADDDKEWGEVLKEVPVR